MEMLKEWVDRNQSKLLEEWDYIKNVNVDIDTISAHSEKKVYWRCEKGHSYYARISKRVLGQGCSYCANKKVLIGYNDLESQYPEIAREWDEEKNIISPKEMLATSQKKAYWKCQVCGNHWNAIVYERTIKKRNCPECTKKRIAKKRSEMVFANTGGFAANYPELLVEWDYLNNTIDPMFINIGYGKKVFWIGECGHSYSATISNKIRGGGCCYCSGKKVLQGFNDLQSKKPEVAKDWDVEANGGELSSEIYYQSSKKYWWSCWNCGDKYFAAPLHQKNPGCRKCKAQQRGNVRKMEYIKKNGTFEDGASYDLMLDWNYEKNSARNIFPSKISKGSTERVWWKCHICGHEWEDKPANRIRGRKCGVCSNLIVQKDYNDLQTKYPELLMDWDYEKNDLLPSEVMYRSSKNYFWRCHICNYSWRTSIKNRVAGTNCPKCKGASTSFAEQAIYYYIKKLFPNTTNRYIEPNSKCEVDIYVPELQLGIEYDGYRYHKNSKLGDDNKTKILSNLGIKLIRVRERDYDDTELPLLEVAPYSCLSIGIKNRYKELDCTILEIVELLTHNDLGEMKIDVYKNRFEILHRMYQGREEKSFKSTGSVFIKYWDEELNYPLKISEINPNSHVPVNWKCDVCGYRWIKNIPAMMRMKGCPKCTHEIVSDEYNFAVLYPDLLSDWDYEKNNISPYELFPKSHLKCFWRCHNCGYEWLAPISRRANGSGCVICGKEKQRSSHMKPVIQIDRETQSVLAEYPSARIAAEKTGVDYKKISACCNHKRKSSGGFVWEFKNC